MQGGRLRPDDKKSEKPRGGMARWEFGDGPALLLTEAGTEHRAGVWLLKGDPEGREPVDHLGPDADEIDRQELARRLGEASERIHGFLRDQRHIAGIGRLLANEILHAAKISPFANTNKLDDVQVDRLFEAMTATIARGIEFERTLDEMGKSADRPSNVHHRVGEDCVVCGDEVRSVEYRRYTVASCATCQTGGKVLADNTTSKFPEVAGYGQPVQIALIRPCSRVRPRRGLRALPARAWLPGARQRRPRTPPAPRGRDAVLRPRRRRWIERWPHRS